MELLIVIGFIGTATLMVAEMYTFLTRGRPILTDWPLKKVATKPATSVFQRRIEAADNCYDAAA